jgi:hypothetical protein
MTRTERTSWQASSRAMGSRSLAKPGSMPEVKQEVPPSAQAFSRASTHALSPDFGWMSGTTEVDTTSLPEARMRHRSCTASPGRRSAVAL